MLFSPFHLTREENKIERLFVLLPSTKNISFDLLENFFNFLHLQNRRGKISISTHDSCTWYVGLLGLRVSLKVAGYQKNFKIKILLKIQKINLWIKYFEIFSIPQLLNTPPIKTLKKLFLSWNLRSSQKFRHLALKIKYSQIVYVAASIAKWAIIKEVCLWLEI